MRWTSAFAFGLTLVAASSMPAAHGQDYPSKPIHIIVGFPPGSAADISARVVGDHMSKTLGQQIIVEARPGAGSSLAAEFVARSAADGYTLFIGTSSNVTNAAVSSDLRFDVVKDFAPIAPLTGLPLILAVHPSTKISSFKELVAAAKAKPGELTYASVGAGTVPHLATEMMAMRTGIKLVHVPYQGSPPAVTDLLGGRVSMMLGVASTMMPHVNNGGIRGLASSPAKRPHIAPNLPTLQEAGLPDFDVTVWFGLFAPAGTPRSLVDKLAGAANKALQADEVGDKLRKAGFEPLGGSPDEFGKLVVRDLAMWKAAAAAANFHK